jgi:Secretion system C-terminal sorting domain/Carbohydrate binding domain
MKYIKFSPTRSANLSILFMLFCSISFTQNLLQNGDFESNSLQPWTSWLPTSGSFPAISNTNQRSGQYCVQVIGRQTSLEQVVTGLSPNTNYIFSGWIKCASGAAMWLGVKDFGGAETHIVGNATTYTKYQVSFKTGSSNTSTTLYFFRHSTEGNTDLSWGDDFELKQDNSSTCTSQILLTVSSSSIWNVRHKNQPFSVSVTPTISTPVSGLQLSYKWLDFFGQVQYPLTNLSMGVSNNITLPSSMHQGYYELVFETNNTSVCLPQRLSGQKREFGFVVLPDVLSSNARTLTPNSRLGIVHINADDPYICPGYSKILAPATPTYYPTSNDWLSATNGMKQKGYYETTLVVGDTYWNTDDTQPVSVAFLNTLKSYLQGYFQTAPSIVYWELGIEENLSGRYGQSYYWSNLTKKFQAARQAANAVNPNVKLIYQIANLDINSIRAFFQSTTPQYVDILSWHPYPWQNYPQSYPMPDTWVSQWMQDIKAIKTQYGYTSMPIWFTEAGTTHHGNPGGSMQYPGGALVQGHTRYEAAVYTAKMHALTFTNEVEKLYWYNYQDRGNDPTHPEDNFGMKDYWGFPKANYATYYFLTEAIKGSNLVFQNLINNQVFMVEFQKNSQESWIIAWSNNNGEPTTIALQQLRNTLNSSNVISTLATDGSPISPISGNNITIPNYPIFIKYTPNTVLPLEWLNLQAYPLSKTIQLNWQTATEKNAGYFDVEKSNDGKIFKKMGQVKAHGNSITLRDYAFIDETPLNGVNYYRLRQVDNDGKETLSNIVSVMFKGSQILKIFPNPVTNKLTIISDSNSEYIIFDVIGREVKRGLLLNNQTEIDVSHLPSAMYYVKTKDESAKFFKE